jgi:4-hydroxybenzoate polyprenyltransferase
MAKACHFGPTVLVVSITFILSITQLSAAKSFGIAIAILAGQLVVGWTNDLLDHPLDRAAGRLKKPLVKEDVTRKQLQVGISIALVSAILLSFLGPLGLRGGLLHMMGLASATIYNFWAKSTWFSAVPYAVSFGALPWAVYFAAKEAPPAWLFVDFILVSTSFHFLNVVKDMEWDRTQKIFGLPQRIGAKYSVTFAILACLLSLCLFFLRSRFSLT